MLVLRATTIFQESGATSVLYHFFLNAPYLKQKVSYKKKVYRSRQERRFSVNFKILVSYYYCTFGPRKALSVHLEHRFFKKSSGLRPEPRLGGLQRPPNPQLFFCNAIARFARLMQHHCALRATRARRKAHMKFFRKS